jgi:RNA polymerase sigma-70 factor (ECF subfamily)
MDISDLYQEHGDALRRFIAKKLPQDEVDDLMHDTFIRVLCLSDDYLLHNPRNFLFHIASNLISDYHRKKCVNCCMISDNSTLFPCLTYSITPEHSLYTQQRIVALQHAIAKLPPRCQQVFLLYKFKCKSHADIAKELGISINMVEKHVIRAISFLKQNL